MSKEITYGINAANADRSKVIKGLQRTDKGIWRVLKGDGFRCEKVLVVEDRKERVYGNTDVERDP